MLAEALLARGHQVIWWSSTFSHQLKKLVATQDTDLEVKPGFRLRMLHAGGYKKNVSISRLIHHRRLAIQFARSAKNLQSPDLIICAYPIIELAFQAAGYARKRKIPLIVDIRDQWPTTFLHVSPRALKPIVFLFVHYTLIKSRRILKSADRLVAMSSGCLSWGLNQSGRFAENGHRVFYIGYSPELQDQEEMTAPISHRLSVLHQYSRDKVIFTFVGSFGYSYELSLILDVAEKMIQNKRDEIHFVLAGDGEQFRSIENRVKNLPNVSLTGWLNNSEVRYLLSFSHAGLLPILNFGEGTFPNKLFEYFANSLPVISSIQNEMAEIIAKKGLGFTYPCGDVQAFYNSVIKMTEDKDLRAKFGKNAKDIFENQFDARSIYSDYAAFSEEVAKRYVSYAQAHV